MKTSDTQTRGYLQRVRQGLGLDELDISERFFNIILVAFTVLLFTQIFYAILLGPNTLNIIVTILAFVVFLLTTLLIIKSPYKGFVKWFFLGALHVLMVFFWFSSEGLQGSLTTTITVCIFVVAVTVPDRYNKIAVALSFLFYSLLAVSEFVFPDLILPYNSLLSKKIDILMATLFNSLVVGLSFVYLRGEYAKKVEEERVQKEQQKQLNEELDNFVYRTSHDLRAPIASSLGLLDLIAQTDKPEERDRFLELQRRSLLKLDDFIREILNYSRNTRLEVTQSFINFPTLIEDAVAQLQFGQPERQLDIRIDCPDDLLFYCDKIRLQIVFNNLISNAFCYCDNKKPTSFLHIQIGEREHTIEIVLQDNGQGIRKEYIPKIFEMFFRANTTSSGSGVGLYIVKQTLQKLGGTIVCESEFGQGTTFKIELPKQVLG